MRRRRICIITPGQLGSNPRVVKEAHTLSEAGFDVHVVATKVADFVEPRDQAIMATAPFKVLRIAFDERLPWLGERVMQVAARRASRAIPALPVLATAHSAMSRRLADCAAAQAADLYIAHYVAALPAARRAALRHHSCYAFDAEDFHLGDTPDDEQHALDRGLISAIERRCLKDAAYISAASRGIADAYEQTYKVNAPTVLLNTFPLRQAPPGGPTLQGSALPRPSLYWFSQTIGSDRGLESALHALALARSSPYLHIRGTFARGYETALMSLAASLGVAERLRVYRPALPEDMVRLAAHFDAGLVSETGATRNRRIALTNKQFTYLLAGIPAVMSNIPAHIQFAAEADGAAFLYRSEDPPSLAAALDTLFSSPERLAKARRRASELAHRRFAWEHEAPRLLACVERALS